MILKIDSSSVNLEHANFVERICSNFDEVFQSRDLSEEEEIPSEDAVKRCTKIVDGIQDFLLLLSIPSAQLKYSVFVSPLLQALGDKHERSSGLGLTAPVEYEYLHSLLLWEDMERFRKHYTDSPPWISLKSVCLLPYFTSKIILDGDSHMIRSASLGHREILSSHYKALNRQLSQEITRPRMSWESTTGLIQSTCRTFLELTHKWESLFQDESGLQRIRTWKDKLEDILRKEEGELESGDMAELGCVMVEASCFIMETTTYLPVVDPSVENEILAKYLSEEVRKVSSTKILLIFQYYYDI